MESIDVEKVRPIELIWVCDMPIREILHGATWLSTSRALNEIGCHVVLISPGESGHTTIEGVEVYGLPSVNVYLIRRMIDQLSLLRYVLNRAANIDVVLFHEMAAPILLLYGMIRRLLGKRRPLMVMDSRTLPMEREDKETWKDRIRKWYNIWMNDLSNRFADGRTVITDRMAKVLQVPDEKLWGIWTSGTNLEPYEGVFERRIWEEPLNLIYIGCMHYERNLMTMSKAVVRAHEEGMDVRLILVGYGTEWEDLAEFAETTDGVVKVYPSVPREEVSTWLQRGHVGVLPFPDEEKFQVSSPIKLFEYMAAGLPILATRIVCHTDVIDDGKYVFWAEGSDGESLLNAIREVWMRRDSLRELGELSLQDAPKWTWKASAQNLKAAFLHGLKHFG